MYSPLDYDTVRSKVFDAVTAGVQARFPLKNQQHTLEVTDLHYDGPDTFSLSDQKKAILGKGTLSRPLKGTWVLRDNVTNEPISKRSTTIAHAPYLTERGTYILNGSEYSVSNQLRLRPGVYTRFKASGETEAHFNVKPGTGQSFRIVMDPKTGIFNFNLGQSNVSLYPILGAMGITDKELEQAWGKELLEINKPKNNKINDHIKAWRKLSQDRALQGVGELPEADFNALFSHFKLTPEVVERTLGVPAESVNRDTILAATQKMLRLNKGEAQEDNRDSIEFQEFWSAPDFFKERIEKDSGMLARKLLYKATLKKDLAHLLPGTLSPQIRSVFTTSGLAQPLEEVNLVDPTDQNLRVLRIGEGGMSKELVPDAARNVQLSQMLFIDPIRSPECAASGMEIMSRQGWISLDTITGEEELACMIDGKLEYHKPSRVIHEHYEGPMYRVSTRWLGYSVTPNHRLFVQPYDSGEPKWRIELAADSFEKPRRYMCGGHKPYTAETTVERFTLPGEPRPVLGVTPPGEFNISDWLEFLGWFLTEGNTARNGSGVVTRVDITQVERVNTYNFISIEALLGRMGLPFSLVRHTYKGVMEFRGFSLNNRQLATYLHQFGLCDQKYIPEYAFEAPVEARKAMMEAMLNGDGRRNAHYDALCTTSKRLAEGFARLAFSLGYSTNTVREEDEREERYLGCYVVTVHRNNYRVAHKNRAAWDKETNQHSKTKQLNDYSIEQYFGLVHCATVPGGLIYVRMPGKFGHWSGNSGSVGVDMRLASNVLIGDDHKMYTKVLDPRGKEQLLAADQLLKSVVAFPGEVQAAQQEGRTKLRVVDNGKVSYAEPDKIDFFAPDGRNLFSLSSNWVPMSNMSKGGRLLMAGKMINQALPLVEGDVPLVQAAAEDGESYDTKLGRFAGVKHAPVTGVVEDVNEDAIIIRDAATGELRNVELYNSQPLNRKTFIHSRPRVMRGDTVKAGSVLADTAMTKDGDLAVGKNLRVAYSPYNGLTYEDACIISESAAKKLTSEQMFTEKKQLDDRTTVDKLRYIATFPSIFTKEQLDKVDKDGVIKKGTLINSGDPLILATSRKTPKQQSMLYRGGRVGENDDSTVWDHDYPGEVTDVWRDGDNIKLAIKAFAPMMVGDKLCYDDQTEVLTEQGWKPFSDVKVGELALSVNPGTMKREFVPVAKVYSYPHNDKMYRLHGEHVDACVTLNHKMFCKLDDTTILLEAAKLLGKEATHLKNVHASDMAPLTPEQDLLCNVISAGLQFGAKRVGDTLEVNGIPSCVIRMFPRCAIAGMASDQLESAVFNTADKAIPVFGTWKVAICDKELVGKLSGLEDGNIPEYAYTWNEHACRVLFSTLFSSYRLPFEMRGVVESKSLADSLQKLAILGGWWLTIRPFNGSYALIVGIAPEVKSTAAHVYEDLIDYSGNVWCCLLERNHVLMIRRNGKHLLCGNSGRYGDKHIVSKLIPDDQMPTDDSGRPLDIIVNPLGVISRENPVQLVEAALGKVAERTGKVYKLNNFDTSVDMVDFALNELAKNGLKSEEDLFDPMTGKKLPGILTGNRFYMKLHHTVAGKYTDRGEGAYTAEGIPTADPGGDDKPKRVGFGEMMALLAHGATENVRDIRMIKGQRNDDYWRQIMEGKSPPLPEIPNVYRKLLTSLQAAGINVSREGNKLHLTAMTDRDVGKMSQGEITSADLVKWTSGFSRGLYGEESLEPVKGGLFDRAITGGHNGLRWGHYTLSEPIVQPVMEEAAARLLGLTKEKLLSVQSGAESLKNGLTGGDGIRKALSQINVEREIAAAKETYKTAAGITAKDGALKRLKFLEMLDRAKLSPADLIITKVPILPPIFRPVSVTSNFTAVAGVNRLYKDMIVADKNLKKIGASVGGETLQIARRNMYDSVKAVTGLGDPIGADTQQKGIQGVLRELFGSSPKLGLFQHKIISTPVDFAARTTVIPNPELNIDQIGIPEEAAWKLYAPFVLRRMMRAAGGDSMAKLQAIKAVKNRTQQAKTELVKEMEQRPVVATRAPVLHKYGLMAFTPVLSSSKALEVAPPMSVGFGLDHDGDNMNFHVLISDSAIDEAKRKLMPSRAIMAPADFKPMYAPRNEFLLGLYEASSAKPKINGRKFADLKEAMAAYKRGEIGLSDVVSIGA